MLENHKPKFSKDCTNNRQQFKHKRQRSQYEVLPRVPRQYLQNVVEGKSKRFLRKCISLDKLSQGNSPSRRIPDDDQNQEGITSVHVSMKDEDSDLFGFVREKCNDSNDHENVRDYDATANADDDDEAITNGTLDGCNSDDMTINLSEDDDVDNDNDDDYLNPLSAEVKETKQNGDFAQESLSWIRVVKCFTNYNN